MRLNVIELKDATTAYRCKTRLEGQTGRCPDHRHQGIEGGPGSPFASSGQHNVGTNGQPDGGGTGFGAPLAAAVSPERPSPFVPPQDAMGWAAMGVAELGGGTSVLGSVGRTVS